MGTVSFDPREVRLGDWLDSLVVSVLGNLSAPGIYGNSANIRLDTRFDYQGTVSIDPKRLLRAASNVIANAIDAMPDGGTLAVSTALSSKEGEGCWEIEVEDTGSGIPAEMRPKIFEPFVSHGKERGTGLGLAVAKNLLKPMEARSTSKAGWKGKRQTTNPGRSS